MIVLFSGTPGSGKSLHQARNMIIRLEAGFPVIANYPINTKLIKCKGKFTEVDNDDLTPQFLRNYATEYFMTHKFREGEIHLYIDEAQLLFNAREWDKKDRKEWLKFFTQHRKLGYDIYLVAQFDRMLDRQIRSLIEYEYIHRKMANMGIKGKLLSLILGGKTFVSVCMWYPLRERLSWQIFHYRKKLSQIYDSYKNFG